ncbi:hypothetical protein GCM10027290_29270 [Micromonospora sonneratiae]|uniref:SMC-Scp complex subunit ScpB n=1 Tax=Micromonospora sonneratiae TaxID=1184706 RepID=A0ABW3YGF2_9ACTN
MTSDDRGDSLADQAAAWVPPWARERRTDSPPAAEPDGPTDSPAGSGPDGSTSAGEDVEAAGGADTTLDVAGAAAANETVVTPEAAPKSTVEPVSGEAAAAGTVPEATPAGATDVVQPADDEPVVAPVAAAADQHEPDVTGKLSTADSARTPEPAAPSSTDTQNSGTARSRTSTLALVDDDELRGALEAILLVVDEPVTEIVLAQVLEQPTQRIAEALDRIAQGYTAAGHGFELRRAAGGWRLYTRPEYAGYVERFILDGQTVRLTQAALETLAVVAYKQPVTRSRISAIRGVNCDGVIRTLVSRGLIEECGTEPDSGAFLYRTTTLFLEKLGLDAVTELPPLAPFLPDNVEEMVDAPR